MQPNLADYQSAAQQIYQPQMQAEQIQLAATRDTTKNALESQKGQVSTDYQSAIDALTNSVTDQSGQINQLYSQRLGGNFSGLQGNDMGKMFSRANQQQGIIEQTRANKLSQITAGETNADITYGAGMASLTPKYQSLETQYAQSAYGQAVKDYQTQQLEYAKMAQSAQQHADTMNLGYARLASSNAKSSQPSMAQIKQNDMATIASSLQGKAGKDGHVSQETWNAAMAQWLGAGYSAKDFVNSNMQFINQRYKGYHGYY